MTSRLDPARPAALPKTTARQLIVLAAITLAALLQPAFGQGRPPSSPAPNPAVALERHDTDASFTQYKLRNGEALPDLRIHYVTLGRAHKNTAGAIDNAILLLHWTMASSQALLVPEYQQALFAPGAPFDAQRYFVIIPDDIGHGQSSKPSNGLKAAFAHYDYGDMVDLQHKLVVESLGIKHLRAVVGMSMGCMNAWQWAEDYPDSMDGIMPIACFPTPISGRNLLWRKILVDIIKSDPLWENGNYQAALPSATTAIALARMMIDGVPHLQEEIGSPEAADAFVRGVKSQATGVDANDIVYSFESSKDFNAEPDLGRIKTKVFALNFADDEFYRDSLQILQRDIQQVRQGKAVIRPTSAGSAGHFSMAHPDLWKDQAQAFMQWSQTH
jgi:homoserine O-acetyltransferase